MNKFKKPSCTLLVCGCDANVDILDPFFTLLKKYWPDLKYDIVLSTETTNYIFNGYKIINVHPNNPNCACTDRILDAIQKIKTKQIVFMLDDFFLSSKVDSKKISQIVEWLANDNKIACFTLWYILGKNKLSKYSGFDERDKKAPYKLAVTAGIWNKKWLIKYYKNQHCNAWQFERRATERSYKLLFPGKFFILQEKPDNILPYNLAEIGLYSGMWMEKTKKIFDDNDIRMNYQKRGWYDPQYSALAKSRVNGFSIKSSILAFCPRYIPLRKKYSKKPIKPGNFKQVYNFVGKNFFKWVISDIYGFSLSNLKIRITYFNGKTEIIDNNQLFGGFLIIKDKLVFNNSDPSIYIATKPGGIFRKIEISGYIEFPATKNELKLSYQKSTTPSDKRLEDLYHYFLSGTLTSRDFASYTRMKPVFNIDGKMIDKKYLISEGKIKLEYPIPKKADKATLLFSDNNIFCIKKLRVYVQNENSQKLIKVNLAGLPQKHFGWRVFSKPYPIDFIINGGGKVIITGIIKRTLSPFQLRKLI